MKKYGAEFKVGLFVTLGVLGLLYLVLSTGKVNFKKQGYYVYASFNDVSGLMPKAPVRLNGLEAGKVEEIALSDEPDATMIKLKLWIDQKIKIRANSSVSIKTLGMMGEKYVQITSSKEAGFIAPDTLLLGKDSSDMDALVEQAQQISKEVSQQVDRLLASLNSTIGDNKESVSNIVKNLESTSANFEAFSEDVKRHPWKLLFKGKEKEGKEKEK